MGSTSSSSWWNGKAAVTVGQICLLATLYFAVGRLGVTLAHHHSNATLVWPPTGLSLAALILYGLRLWPGIAIGVMVLNATTDTPFGASLGIAVGNCLEAITGTLLLVRFAGFRPTLERLQDAAAFLFLGALGCTMVSATIGVTVLTLSGSVEPSAFGTVWLIWWLGDAAGAVILAPTLFMIMHGTPPWRDVFRQAEFWLILASVIGTSCWIFGSEITGTWTAVVSFIPFPLVVLAGSRLGPRVAVTASFSIMVIATLGTAIGLGPFVAVEPGDSALFLWAYGMSMGGIAFTLAAVIGQRDMAEKTQRSEEQQRRRIEQEQLLLLERARITREMHDGLGGQLVSAIAMAERGRGSHAEIAEVLRHTLDEMRIMIDTLDPSTEELRVSLGKFRARMEPVLRRNGIQLTWEITAEPLLSAFDAGRSLHLLRIIQEAVTNAIRHAEAARIDVRISPAAGPRGAVDIEIRDDGSGLPAAATFEGRGIRNMRSRAAALGAALRIDSTEPGTRVTLSVPVAD